MKGMPQGSASKARGASGSRSSSGAGSGSGAGTGGGSGAGSGLSTGTSDGSKSGLGSSGSSSAGRDRSEAQKAMDTQIIGPFLDHGGCELRLVNVTATANMGCPIDLKTVVMRARNAEYNPKRFSACIIRLINKEEPKATALVFKTGKVVVTGARSNASVDYACKTFARILGKLDDQRKNGPLHKITFNLETDRKVQNMVATTDLGFPIRLEGLVASAHGCFCNYEPELFPGLIYRLAEPKICFLVFVSGKVVLTGAKSVQQLEDAFRKMYPVLGSFKKASVLLQTSATAQPSDERARKRTKT